MLVLVAGYVRFGLRSAWDAALFHILIKRFARIPSVDSFVARRIAGPGLSSKYFYQIKPEQALLLLERKIELDELDQFEKKTLTEIDAPLRQFEQKIRTVFGDFGAKVYISQDSFVCSDCRATEVI